MEKKVLVLFLYGLLMLSDLGAQIAPDQQKPIFSPVIKSLILPGMGEFSLGQEKRGRFFLISEIALLTGVTLAVVRAQYEYSSMRSFATEHAAVDGSDESDQFWVNVSNYSSSDAFNNEHLRWREFDSLYPNENDQLWNWDSENSRIEFRNLRVNHDRLKKTASFITGAIVMNHLISAIDALYLTRISKLENISYNPGIDFVSGTYQHSVTIRF